MKFRQSAAESGGLRRSTEKAEASIVSGVTRGGRRVQPMTWVGIVLLVLLVTADAVIWFSRSNDDASAASSDLETTPGDVRRAADSPHEPPSAEPGNYVRSRVTADGRLVTDHYVVTAEPVTSVQTKIRPTAHSDFSPTVDQLKVFADGDRVSTAPLPNTRAPSRIRLGEPSTVIHLQYETSGGVVLSAPSSSGRALALVNPVKVMADAPAGRQVIEVDGQVLSLSCAPGQRVAQPCGKSGGGDGWKVEPNGDKSAVLAQVDTPS